MNNETLRRACTIAAMTEQSIEEVNRQIQAIASTRRKTWTFEMVAEDVYNYFAERGSVPTLEQFEEWLKLKIIAWAFPVELFETKRQEEQRIIDGLHEIMRGDRYT